MAETIDMPALGISKVIGRVFSLYGKVRAIAPDGTVRVLLVDTPVFAMERIVTGGDGGVAIVFDGQPPVRIDIGGMSEVILDEDVCGGVGVTDVADAAAAAEEVQAMLEGGGGSPI